MKKIFILLLIPIFLIGCGIGKSINNYSTNNEPVIKLVNFTNLTELQGKLNDISEKEAPSVVFISTEKIIKQQLINPNNFRRNNQPGEREYKQQGFGSGVIYQKKDDNYYIITNNHVIEGANSIEVTIDQSHIYKGELLGTDPAVDIAIVKINTKDKINAARFGDSNELKVGDFAIAIGNPYGLSGTMTFGIVSALGRNNIQSDRVTLNDFIQTDAAINPGNSGGPLININGEVVGINSMIYTQNGGSVGIGFSIPVNIVRDTAEKIIKTGKSEHGYLGINYRELTEEDIKNLNLNNIEHGMLITGVIKGSPAEKYDIKTDDIIISADGTKTEKIAEFARMIGSKNPGIKIVLKVFRNKILLDKEVILGARS